MNRTFLSAFFLVFTFSASFSQYTPDNYFGRSSSRITKKCLDDAQLVGDILPGYKNLVNYITVVFSVKGEDLSVDGVSFGDTITQEQKSILQSADVCSEIDVKINFTYKDPAMDNYGNGKRMKEMRFTLYVIPDKEAEYPGGREYLKSFLSKSVMGHIKDTVAAKKPWDAFVKFTINEKGEVSSAKIIRTSSNAQIDEWLLQAINDLQKWTPAELSKGKRVEQKFSIHVSGGANPRRSGNGC